VTIDGVWIDNWVYCITVYTLQFNTVHFTTVFPLGRVSSRLGPGPSADPTTPLSAEHCFLFTAGIPALLCSRNSLSSLFSDYLLKSKSHYDRRPVGQCVLVSNPIWGSWPDINYCVTVTVLSISGAPSDERSGPSFDLVTWTASVQCSKFAAGPRQHSISPYL
jgi:hypothetical protein